LILKISENKIQRKEICDAYSSSNKTFKTIKNLEMYAKGTYIFST